MAEQIHSVSRWSKRRSFTHSLTVTVTHSHSSVRWLAFGGHSLTHSLTHCHPLTVFTEYNDDERTNERTSTLLWSPIIDRSVVRSFVRSFVCLPSFVVRCSSSSFVCHHSLPSFVRSFVRRRRCCSFVFAFFAFVVCRSLVGSFVVRSFVHQTRVSTDLPLRFVRCPLRFVCPLVRLFSSPPPFVVVVVVVAAAAVVVVVTGWLAGRLQLVAFEVFKEVLR